MGYEFNNLYRPRHPKGSPEPARQKLQVTDISEDGKVFIVKHLTERGGFKPLTKAVRCIRASTLGAECASDIWLSIHGYDAVFDNGALNIFDVGTAMEPFILSWLQDQLEWEVLANSKDEEGVIIALDGGLVTGHIDALCRKPEITGNSWALCDAKTMNANNYEKWQNEGTAVSKPGYDVQLETYAYAYSRFLDLQYKALVAMNKNTSAFNIEVMDRNQSRWDDVIKPKAERILGSDMFLPQERGGESGVTTSKCQFCSRKAVCNAITKIMVTKKVPEGKRNPLYGRVPKMSENGDVLQVLANVYELYDRNMERIAPEVPLAEALAGTGEQTFRKMENVYAPDGFSGAGATDPEDGEAECRGFDLPF